jgi:sterol desaturase/sphingolipid hydroxylase (fatty acid hydroxylase superfamily)
MTESIGFETLVRLVPFVVILSLMVIWEAVFPKRSTSLRKLRWPGNLGIFILDVVMLSLLPITAVGAALVSIEFKFGLFFWFEFPFWPKVIFSMVILDLLIYWQHRLFHIIKPLWHLHRMHHTDTGFDVTTALRFHPLEIILSVLVKAVAIIMIGAPVFAVIAFEIILNGSAMFNHGNIRMPKWLDSIIRIFIVTPDMHRVHHSTIPEEHNTNFGFALSIWDRIFGSYVAQPSVSHENMTIGLDIFNKPDEARIDRLISQPFRNPVG